MISHDNEWALHCYELGFEHASLGFSPSPYADRFYQMGYTAQKGGK